MRTCLVERTLPCGLSIPTDDGGIKAVGQVADKRCDGQAPDVCGMYDRAVSEPMKAVAANNGLTDGSMAGVRVLGRYFCS